MDSHLPSESHLDAWIDDHRDVIIASTQGLLQIPSVGGPPAPGAPFGVETVRALNFALSVAGDYGLTTKVLDGYAGHAEWIAPGTPADAPIVGVLAHVDVVPEGDGWKHPPYGAEIDNGLIYARGAIDDKGPAMAALFGMIAVAQSGAPLTHRLRMILGCDEESGFGCVKHYFEHEEMPATGFTPDACFPLIYAEKGIANLTVTRELPVGDSGLRIVSLKAGLRTNMVPEKAVAQIAGDTDGLTGLRQALASVADISAAGDDGTITVEARGVSAHGSTPELGRNAAGILAQAVLSTGLISGEHRDFLQTLDRWAMATEGETLGIAGYDDVAGPLSCNLGIVDVDGGQVSLTFNVRYPVTWQLDTLTSLLNEGIAGTEYTLSKVSSQGPLYIPLDDPLVTTLLAVYREQTGDMSEPKTIGGGTYARAMTHGIAFGPEFAGRGGGAHQADENWPVDDLIAAAKIYAHAILRLATLK